jgi:hypothetical protein
LQEAPELVEVAYRVIQTDPARHYVGWIQYEDDQELIIRSSLDFNDDGTFYFPNGNSYTFNKNYVVSIDTLIKKRGKIPIHLQLQHKEE